MMDETEFQRSGHSAVHLDNDVIIIGGWWDNKELSTRVIWMYNLYTEAWSKHVIPKYIMEKNDVPELFHGAVAVAINGTIYTFGGFNKYFFERNELWALSRTETGCFTWSFIKFEDEKKSPSPRYGHAGWEYAGKLWVFGGKGHSPLFYLNDHGDRAFLTARGSERRKLVNNQLLCYDPNIQKWTNPQCFGTIPSPRSGHGCSIIKDKVWVFGGSSQNVTFHEELFELTMQSLTWTEIRTVQPRPEPRCLCTLTALTNNQLVLHGGLGNEETLSNTWIMDLTTHSWRQCTSGKDHARRHHTGSLGLNNNVIIIGGYKERRDTYDAYDNTFHVLLEAKSLQQLALRTIHKHEDELNLNYLPMKLVSLL